MRAARWLLLSLVLLTSPTYAEQIGTPALPDFLRPIPGSIAAAPEAVRINGEWSHFQQAAIDLPLARVIEHYLGTCRGRSILAGLDPTLMKQQELFDGIAVEMTSASATLGFQDRDGRRIGVVAFQDPTADVARTQYHLSCTPSGGATADLDPARDLPGADPDGIPRRAGLRRVFSIERPAPAATGLYVYEGQARPREVAEFYRRALASDGWVPDAAVTAEFAAGEIQAARRGECCCELQITHDPATGRVQVTISTRLTATIERPAQSSGLGPARR